MEPEIEEPTQKEIDEAVDSFKNNKATFNYGVVVELLKRKIIAKEEINSPQTISLK